MADHIALLLHMHQPEYRDPETGRPHMPWVRLHACRGYTDVPVLAAEAGADPTINVVPSLLLQLQAYKEGATDRWEELSRHPAEDLHGEDLQFVRHRFVHGHPSMRLRSPRYAELAARAEGLTDAQELRDLQVWSNLAWMGSVARRDPLIGALVAQDRGFAHEQLLALMDAQRRLVGGVLDLWRAHPSLSCSPLCHPILPLLVDFRHARRCMPHLPADLGDAGTFAWPEDALRQLIEGLDVCERLLGRRPQGLWPSEGSVSPEVLDLAAQAGFTWVATDEEILHRSDRDRAARLDGPWVRARDEAGLRLVFRDHGLSDRVGFVYATWQGAAAAADLLHGAQERWGYGPGAVPVILDGENPWESYPDAGQAFLQALFGSGRVCSMDALCQAPAIGRVHRLHTGSWIDGDFRIWAGDPEDRAGWALLARLRRAFEQAGRPQAAWTHLANAESSDWTWWFGPEHHTEVADLFDALFRAHLAAGWLALGLEPPTELGAPLLGAGEHAGLLLPHDVVAPRLNGHLHPSDWAGAAPLPPPVQGSMSRGRSWLLGGAVGVGGGYLHLRLDVPVDAPALVLEIEGQDPIVLTEALHPRDPPGQPLLPRVAVSRQAGLIVAAVPWGGGEVRLAIRSPDGPRHPAEGWLVLRPPPAARGAHGDAA